MPITPLARHAARIALALLALAGAAAARAEPPAPAAAALDTIVGERAGQGFAGSVLVAEGPRVLLSRGYGSAGGAPIAADDRFWIASTGKQFVAAAILLLAERGELSLDDPLGRFFPDAPAALAPVTLAMLLSHNSGIGQSYASEGRPDRASALAAMFAEPPEGEPGSGFRYSNSNFQLAAAVVEAVSGTAYRDFVRDNLFAPAGLAGTGFAGDGGATAAIEGPLPPRLAGRSWGSEGVYSTAPDLFRWVRALRSGGILAPADAARLFAPVPGVAISGGGAALGWFTGRTAGGTAFVFTRGNEDFGANSLIYVYPERDVTIVVLSHAGDAGELSWSRTILGDLENALGL